MNSQILESFFTLMTDAAFGYPIAYEGIKFCPPDSGPWLELSFLPNEGIDQSLSSDSVLSQGILQVNVCNRPNTGIIELNQIAETVMALFPKSTSIFGLVRVSRSPYTSSVITLDDRQILPISISYSE